LYPSSAQMIGLVIDWIQKKKEKKKTGRCNIAKYSFNWFKITIIRRILLPILLLLLIIIITLYPSIAQLIDVVMDWIQ